MLGARVKVQLRLGLVRRLLYALRPGGLLMLLLGAAALAALLGGSGVAAVFIALWVYTGWGGEGQGAGPPSGAEDLSSLAPSEGEMDETSSISGFSEAESGGSGRESGRGRWRVLVAGWVDGCHWWQGACNRWQSARGQAVRSMLYFVV